VKGLRAGICLLVAFAVLAFGAVDPWAGFTLEAGAAGLLVLWGWRAVRLRRLVLHWNWIYLPLALLLGFGLIQYLSGISTYPYATKSELVNAMAILLICFLTEESFRTLGDRLGFFWFLMTLAFAMSLFGIVQHYAFNGKMYWLFPVPSGAFPFGPFMDSDHFAGFVELTAPMGLAMLFGRGIDRERVLLVGVFTIVPVGALVLTGSRGGFAGFLFELLLLAVLQGPQMLSRRTLATAAILVGVAGVFAVWLGTAPLVRRLEASTPAQLSRERRASIFRDATRMALDQPWAGTGLGTFRTVYPHYESYYDGRIVEHAHNDYLELLAEGGLIGGLCGAVFLFFLIRDGFARLRSARSLPARSLHAGALAACGGLLLHGLVDFNFHIPSNALLFLILASLATSREDISTSRRLGS
jgi:O-antigen ligase